MKSIILTGGGTAGHVIPNIALLPYLKKHFDKIYYIGTAGIEKTFAKENNIEFFEIATPKLIRKNIFKNFCLPFKFLSAVKKCKKLLKQLAPDIVFSKGGYVALPVVIAANKLKIPVISHESDFSMGLANKLILKYASLMLTSFEETKKKCKKCKFVGSPLRDEIYSGDKIKAQQICGFSENKKTILCFGGSLGARGINLIIKQCAKEITKKYNLIHIVGNDTVEINLKNYYQTDFVNNIEDFYALSDIVISRAGANSIFELLALKKPMILIPLPKSQSRGDQIENARYFEKKGFAKIILQENLNTGILMHTLENLDEKKMISNMQNTPYSDSNKKIINLILNYTKNNHKN